MNKTTITKIMKEHGYTMIPNTFNKETYGILFSVVNEFGRIFECYIDFETRSLQMDEMLSRTIADGIGFNYSKCEEWFQK